MYIYIRCLYSFERGADLPVENVRFLHELCTHTHSKRRPPLQTTHNHLQTTHHTALRIAPYFPPSSLLRLAAAVTAFMKAERRPAFSS